MFGRKLQGTFERRNGTVRTPGFGEAQGFELEGIGGERCGLGQLHADNERLVGAAFAQQAERTLQLSCLRCTQRLGGRYRHAVSAGVGPAAERESK